MRISEISPVWERWGREVPIGGTSGGLVVRGPSCEICPGEKSEEEFTSKPIQVVGRIHFLVAI